MASKMGFRLDLVFLFIALLSSCALSDLTLTKVDRRIDLTSHIVRITSTVKVENDGDDPVSEFLVAFPDHHAKYLSFLSVSQKEGKGKAKGPKASLPIEATKPEGAPASLSLYSVSLPKGLSKGETLTLDILAVFAHVLKPFPEQVSQGDIQLVLFQDSAYYLSPYAVKAQTLTVKLPDGRVESYTKLEKSKGQGSEIKYGPYENQPPFSYTPIVVHFEFRKSFAVAEKLVREIEVSHWGNVQITEHYNLIHGGALLKGEFSRLDYQTNPLAKGASGFNRLVAKLSRRAHSIYYRDEIGNISTSRVWSDSKKTELEIEPRYPLFGGWKTFFTFGYGLPLKEYLFQSKGKRFLNISFGSSIDELLIDELIVKVVLPEGSRDISVSIPFPVEQWQETKLSHLDIDGRPVVTLQKINAVPEHNQNFQVYYKFNSLSLLREPLMLILGFFFLFISCIAYNHTDLAISKSSPAYLAKLQWDEVQAAVQQLESIIKRRLMIYDKLEASLRELSRTANIQACKIARKTADSFLKELSKEFKPLLTSLQTSPQAAQFFSKADELVTKERELQEKLIAKHSIIVDCYEKKVSGREIEKRIAPHQQKITALRQEVEELLEFIEGI